MIKSLDEILLRNQGRLYLAKDSMMDAGTFAAMYPRKAEFLAVKRKVDPDCFFLSDQAKRVGLCF
jgi:decaprenylphospho-beta-D-ribofuranose 2-oxidase